MPLPLASGMEVDDGDEYYRMLEYIAEYPHRFLEGVDGLEYQLCHYVYPIIFPFSDPFYSQNIQRSLYEFSWARI